MSVLKQMGPDAEFGRVDGRAGRKVRDECLLRQVPSGRPVLFNTHSHGDTRLVWEVCQASRVVPILVDGHVSRTQLDHLVVEGRAFAVVRMDGSGGCEVERTAAGDADGFPELREGGVIHVSSATTGNAKMIWRSLSRLSVETQRYVRRLRITEDDAILSTAPLSHSYGFGSALLPALAARARLVDPGVVLPRKVLGMCREHGVTILHGAPYVYGRLVEANDGRGVGPRMRLCIASGDAMPEGLQDRFRRAFGVPLLQQYGSTETGALAVSSPADPARCVGSPLEGVSFETRSDEAGVNWVYVSSPQTIGVAVTRQGLRPMCAEAHKTGDVGRVDGDGRVFIEGRGDDVAIIAGKKVSLCLVEKVICGFPGVLRARCVVCGSESRRELRASYESDNPVPSLRLTKHCLEHLSPFQVPRAFEHVTRGALARVSSWKREGNQG